MTSPSRPPARGPASGPRRPSSPRGSPRSTRASAGRCSSKAVVSAAHAARALELYRFTTPWLPADDTSAPGGAAELLRHIADGYAVLSHPVETAPLPLPQREFGEVVMRALEIDAWAATAGHPLALDVAAADQQLDQNPTPGTEDRDPALEGELAAAVATAARQHELLEVMCDSATGRTALQSEGFRRYAVDKLVAARGWPYWVRLPHEGVAAWVLGALAETWFVAAHGEIA